MEWLREGTGLPSSSLAQLPRKQNIHAKLGKHSPVSNMTLDQFQTHPMPGLPLSVNSLGQPHLWTVVSSPKWTLCTLPQRSHGLIHGYLAMAQEGSSYVGSPRLTWPATQLPTGSSPQFQTPGS